VQIFYEECKFSNKILKSSQLPGSFTTLTPHQKLCSRTPLGAPPQTLLRALPSDPRYRYTFTSWLYLCNLHSKQLGCNSQNLYINR